MALDIDAQRFVHADGEVVLAVRVGDDPLAFFEGLRLVVQGLVQIAHFSFGKVDGLHVCAPQAVFSQMYMVAGSGSQTLALSMPGRLASAWYSEAMAT